MLTYKNKSYVCHLDLAMDFIRGKWKAVILCHLNSGPKRFLELQRITSGVSHKVLNENLKQLEEDGLISKTVYPEVPPRVEFELTDLGQGLYPALEIIQKWSQDNFTDIKDLNKKKDE